MVEKHLLNVTQGSLTNSSFNCRLSSYHSLINCHMCFYHFLICSFNDYAGGQSVVESFLWA